MAGKGIQIIVGADYNGRDLARAQRDLDKLKREAGTTQSAMGKFGDGMKKQMTPGFAAMGAAVAAAGVALAAFAVQLGVEAVQAAAEEEEAIRRLSMALENVGQGFAQPAVEDFIDNLQRATGVADDQLRPAMQTLVTATQDAAQAQDLLGIALDISAATGKDLTSVSGALAKAANGQFTQINRLTNGAIDPSILKTKDLALVTDELSRLYGGQAAANAETFAGRMRRLSVAADELKESFGQGFIDAFTGSADSTDEMMDSFKAAEPAMRDLGEQFGLLAADVAKLTPYIDELITALKIGLIASLSAVAVFIPALWPVIGQLASSLGDASTETDNLADSFDETAGVVGMGGWIGKTKDEFGDLAGSIGEASDELAGFKDIMSQVDALTNFQDAMGDAKVAVSDYNSTLSHSPTQVDAVRDSLLEMIGKAGEAALATDNMSERANIADQTLGYLTTALSRTEMPPSTRQMLMDAFTEIAVSIGLPRDQVALLQAQIDALKNKTITITVQTVNAGSAGGGQNYGGKDVPDGSGSAMGGLIRGAGTSTSDSIPRMLSNGEFVIRAASVRKFGAAFFRQLNNGAVPAELAMTSRGSGGGGGVYIETINVASAPGERVAESLPRSLRRMAWLAGLGS